MSVIKVAKIFPKHSIIPGSVPSSLDHLQLCINYPDGLVWIGDRQGNPLLITELTNSLKIFEERP